MLWAVKTPDIELKLSEIICEQFSHSQLPREKKKKKKQTKNIAKIAPQERLI